MPTKGYIYFEIIVAQIFLNFAALSNLINQPHFVHVVFWTLIWKWCTHVVCSIIETHGT